MRLYRVRPGGRWFHPAVQRLGAGMSLAVALTLSGLLTPALGWVGELNAGWFAFGAYALLCTLVGAVSRPSSAPLVGLSGWLFFNGFAVHRYAALGWAGRADLLRLGVLTAVALCVALPGSLPRRKIRTATVPLADLPVNDRC
ncbi:hypothetical protein GCM10010441_40620 [Kitasatospora paracochleata]|uniref:Uncharacterized protein n=1 Tax=Kitasatospora paracochleata TaxID=58354 RepID=A0ABT1IVQ6_9ACTN|nr:hypothetical protein [Kitasatospora paracochleata]MCP2309219.1 hypothetical protein [Kitasatospora paracochleata]